MAGPIKRALVEMGYRVREYAPVGEMLPGMAYLVRRLLENTSNEGFLRAKFVGKVDAQILLADPRSKIKVKTNSTQSLKKDLSEENEDSPMTSFQNEALVDFSISSEREKIES